MESGRKNQLSHQLKIANMLVSLRQTHSFRAELPVWGRTTGRKPFELGNLGNLLTNPLNFGSF